MLATDVSTRHAAPSSPAPAVKKLDAVETDLAALKSNARGYVPGGDSATRTILDVAATGKLAVLGSVASAQDAHCVAADDAGHAYVCAPSQGAVLVVNDPFPASR